MDGATATSAFPVPMASSALRAGLAASQSIRRTAVRRAPRVFARNAYTPPLQGERPLENWDDWQDFQSDRHAFKQMVDVYSEFGSNQTRENTFQPHHTLHRPLTPSQATLSALIAASAHLGHSKSLMNPNFMPYAYGVRADITIIDLDQTLPLLRRAASLTRAIAARDGTIVFVGTRKDLQPAVVKAAERIGPQAYNVGERWLPGTLTNRFTMFGAGIKEQRVIPDLVIFLNPLANMNAIRECAIQHVPTIGIVDSNVDPRIVMYPIPANDESTRTAELITGMLSIAGKEGKILRDQQQSQMSRRNSFSRTKRTA